jgi:hypothetical protein
VTDAGHAGAKLVIRNSTDHAFISGQGTLNAALLQRVEAVRPKPAFRKDVSGVIPCDVSLLSNVRHG